MKRIRRIDIQVGKPLPWPVYDKNGRLLLRAGVHIAFERQIDKLVEQGMFIQDDEDSAGIDNTPTPSATNTFECLLAAGWTQKQLVNELLSSPPSPDVAHRIVARATKICQACAADGDAALAAVHLDFHNPYPLAHPVHSAVLCALLSTRLGASEAERRSTVCAALTCDLGMFEFPHIEKQKTPLDDAQVAAMRRHVAGSAAILELAGVVDAVWIDTVLCHHERIDGSGYPGGLGRADIPLAARILAVADTYTALIKPLPYREARSPFDALAELLAGMGRLYDTEVCGALVKEVGTYPPGSFVRLANGETAVVKARRKSEEWPVHSVYGVDGLPYLSPRLRNAATADFGIKGGRAQGECRAAESIARRLWA